MTEFNSPEVRFYAQQFSSYQQGGTPVGVKDRKVGRLLAGPGPIRKSKANSRTIRRAAARQARRNANLSKTQSKGF